MVIYRYRQGFFGCILANHIFIQGRPNFLGLGDITHFETYILGQFFLDYLITEFDTLITDVHSRPSYQFFYLILGLSAEGALQLAFFIPAILLLGGLFVGAVGILWHPAWWMLLGGVLLSLLILALSGLQAAKQLKSGRAFFVVPFLTCMHHFWYAVGTLHAPLSGYRKIFADTQGRVSDPFGDRKK